MYTEDAGLGDADGVLDVAKAVLVSADYVGKKTAVDTTNAALSAAQLAGTGALNVAKVALEGVDKVTGDAGLLSEHPISLPILRDLDR